MDSLTFGDTFRYNEKEYIFLAKTEDKIYTAQILTPVDTEKVDKLFKMREATNKPTNLTIYCYVILQTADFKDRAALLHNTGNVIFTNLIEKLPIFLGLEDLKNIKMEITKKNTISIELKELVQDIQLNGKN
ncbi:MAG: hypothetical protein Q7S77_02330 [Candidatus Staskawiczbacteria bacterium]|nr:hypothetical protein [Candidatus Staskawiczbacteria bacterium]